MISTMYLLKLFQDLLKHLLRLRHLALIGLENSQVVDRVQRRCVLGTPCLLLSF